MGPNGMACPVCGEGNLHVGEATNTGGDVRVPFTCEQGDHPFELQFQVRKGTTFLTVSLLTPEAEELDAVNAPLRSRFQPSLTSGQAGLLPALNGESSIYLKHKDSGQNDCSETNAPHRGKAKVGHSDRGVEHVTCRPRQRESASSGEGEQQWQRSSEWVRLCRPLPQPRFPMQASGDSAAQHLSYVSSSSERAEMLCR